MTTSHRPTWNPAVGGTQQGGMKIHAQTQQFSARDLPGHTKLKARQMGQNTRDEMKSHNYKEDLEDRERRYPTSSSSHRDRDRERDRDHHRDRDYHHRDRDHRIDRDRRERDKDKGEDDVGGKEEKDKENEVVTNVDADDEDDQPEKNPDDDDEEDDEDEDDEAELLKELEKIKRERSEEQLRKQAEESARREQAAEEAVLTGNPLINNPNDSSSKKRKWFEDSVFKNQAKTQLAQKKRFINDTIRNDFHRRFLDKYVQ